MTRLVWVFCALAGCFYSLPSLAIIYGQDDRIEVYQESDPFWLERSQSVAAIFNTAVHPGSIIDGPQRQIYPQPLLLKQKSMNDKTPQGFCAMEPFVMQPATAACTAFLVAEDLMLTAAHCIYHPFDLMTENFHSPKFTKCDQDIRFVFDYELGADKQIPWSVPEESVYRCKKIEAASFMTSGQNSDWALVRLDRPVKNRTPLTLSKRHAPARDTPLTLIGHPMGLPKKIAHGGKTLGANKKDRMIIANLDAFGGNSGSPVFDTQNGDVIGILVGSGLPTDRIFIKELGCWLTRRVSDDFYSERISPAMDVRGYIR